MVDQDLQLNLDKDGCQEEEHEEEEEEEEEEDEEKEDDDEKEEEEEEEDEEDLVLHAKLLPQLPQKILLGTVRQESRARSIEGCLEINFFRAQKG